MCGQPGLGCRGALVTVSVSLLSHRLTGAGGRKKIFRLSDVLKPLTDAQVEAMKLGAVKRILRAEKAVACSGAAQVCAGPSACPHSSVLGKCRAWRMATAPSSYPCAVKHVVVAAASP